MRYLRKINEQFLKEIPDPNGFAKKLCELVNKSISDSLGKIHLDDYDGDLLFKRNSKNSHYLNKIGSRSGGTLYTNKYEKENIEIEYRYSSTFSKKFNIVDKNSINKQLKIYQKHLDIFNKLSEIKEKMKEMTYYCDIKINNIGKTSMEICITMGFSEDLFMGKAMKKVNNI
tara:strand:+ start:17544 stop:18059 length:516 start_codon:yes stop_codon:yes gene_type:complete